jgi:hypothetical protein
MRNRLNLLTKLKDPRTNWKYILIVILLAFSISIGILIYFRHIMKDLVQLTEIPELKKLPKNMPFKEHPQEYKKETLPERILITEEDIERLKIDNLEGIIAHYLNSYPAESDILEKLVVKENKVEVPIIKWIQKYDLDLDGIEEIIIGFSNPWKEEIEPHSKFGWSIISMKNGKYRLAYRGSFLSEEGSEFYDVPMFKFIRDINKDNVPEIVITMQDCGAHDCFSDIEVVTWNGKEYVNLASDVESMANAEITLNDLDNDGIEEIILYGGTFASAGAGYQRKYKEIYRFDLKAGKYVFNQRIKDANDIYFLVLDANEALKNYRIDEALKIARKALQNPQMFDKYYITEKNQVRILAYATIEAMLAYLKQLPPNLTEAEFLLNEAQQKYNKFNNPYVPAAQILFQTYVETKDLFSACKKMEVYVLNAGKDAEFLEWYGYNTEKINLEDVCPWD